MGQYDVRVDGRVVGQPTGHQLDAASERAQREPRATAPTVDEWIWPTVTAALTAVLATVLLVGLGQPWRPVTALVFLAVGPGASLVPLIGIPDFTMELTLVVPVSFALVALSSAALFYTGLWSADRELLMMFALCLVGLVLQWFDAWRSALTDGATR
jgi:hypothetical protein